ncbi:VanZ family protein [Lutispora thermophila]|nr:VanZ family protein [Lutispora thermophila]
MRKYSIFKKLIWVITVLWMCMIFYFSHQPGEVSRMESGKILHKMDLIQENDINTVDNYEVLSLQRVIRKWAHKIIYFTLGILFVLSIINTRFTNIVTYLISFIAATVYGATDELHQMFVPGRGPLLSDVFLDSVSALTGVVFIAVIIELLKKTKFDLKKFI